MFSWITKVKDPITDENFSKAITEDRFKLYSYTVGAGVDRCPFSLLNFIEFQVELRLILGMLDAEEEKKYIRYWFCFTMNCMIKLVVRVLSFVLDCLSVMRLISGREKGTGLGKICHVDLDILKKASGVWLNVEALTSIAVVDLRDAPVTLIMPEKGTMLSNPNGVRYQFAQFISEEHYSPLPIRTASGKYVVTEEMIGSRYCTIVFRTQINHASKEDMMLGEEMRRRILLKQNSKPRNMLFKEWNRKELIKFQQSILKKQSMLKESQKVEFRSLKRGAMTLADHNISTASNGGVPSNAAVYLDVESKYSLKTQTLLLRNVPVDAFWALTIYKGNCSLSNAECFTVCKASVKSNKDGSVMLWFGTSCPKCAPKTNFLEIFDGWKGLMRLYSPTEKYFNGEWQLPPLELVQTVS